MQSDVIPSYVDRPIRRHEFPLEKEKKRKEENPLIKENARMTRLPGKGNARPHS